MKGFITKKQFSLITILIVVGLSVFITAFVTSFRFSPSLTLDEMYQAAVLDALIFQSDDIYPLVSLIQGDPLTTWNDTGQVLLVTWNDTPELYPRDATVTTEDYEVWTFTDKEIAQWYRLNNKGVKNWDLRFKQLLGLPPNTSYSHFTAFWVSTENILRPAYNQDVTFPEMPSHFESTVDETFLHWFNNNKLFSYFEELYPWTRLGYTYDWGSSYTNYGLTEFIVLPNTSVNVKFTLSTNEFLKFLESQIID
ncbi:MAG: hypothetical protein FWG98_05495 [Candidatus Cloacimonetes bacterium]|nr:hypothetical protein [Candidatus Cloacimonadota bacterium]